MSIDVPDPHASRDRHPVLSAVTVGAALAGLVLGIRAADAGYPALPSILTGVVALPLAVWLAGRVAISLARGRGLAVLERWTGGRSAPSGPPPEALLAWGRGGEAVEVYRREAERNPDDPGPWLSIARIERLELKRPGRALHALEKARERVPPGSTEAGRVARGIAELHLGPLGNPRAAMPELARAAEALEGTTSGEWARRELAELKERLASGELDRLEAREPRPPEGALHEMEVLLRTRYGLVHLRTEDEERAESLLREVADRLALPLVVWTPGSGLKPRGSSEPVYGTGEPAAALRAIESGDRDVLYHLRSLSRYLEGGSPTLTQLLADAVRSVAEGSGALVVTAPDLRVPEELRGLTAVLPLPGPDRADYRTLVARVLRDVEARTDVEVAMTLPEQDRLVTNLRGLGLVEAGRLLTGAIVEDGRLAAEDIEKVIAAKREATRRGGVLEYFPAETEWTEVADLAGLKEWLAKRREVIRRPERAREFGLGFPRGILLLGVPGCGKSLCAKAVAADWGLPLLKLDPSDVYEGQLGESESNFRRALASAERMAPLVLWIDEIEKGFAAADRDGGVSRRILGTFLSWMQDREDGVFVVATANEARAVPPELLRKGRFDEIFFVDLPDPGSRAGIFEIHLRSRGRDPGEVDLEGLAEATDGFSGAEIEEVVVSTLYHSFSTGEPVTTERLLEEARRTRPLSVTRADRVDALRRWARGRTRSAGAAPEA